MIDEAEWHEALYGADGFYRRERPAGHFTTSTHGPLGALLAEALLALADEHRVTRVVDVAAGRGELLSHLHTLRPGLALTGVDVVDRPDLPAEIDWLCSPGGAALPDRLADLDAALVVAHEWLDVVPCPVVRVEDVGHLPEADRAWVRAHWPTEGMTSGSLVEVGRPRDVAWSGLLARLRSGVAVAVDYGHTRDQRPPDGTLTAYREGRIVEPVADGSCDLTAHVAVDSLERDELLTQREALHRLGIHAEPPPHGLASTDPTAYLQALARSSTAAALTDPAGLGGFWWVIAHRPRPARHTR